MVRRSPLIELFFALFSTVLSGKGRCKPKKAGEASNLKNARKAITCADQIDSAKKTNEYAFPLSKYVVYRSRLEKRALFLRRQVYLCNVIH